MAVRIGAGDLTAGLLDSRFRQREPLDPIMAGPAIDEPLYAALADADPGPVPPGHRRHPRRHHHPAGDEPPLRGGLPRRRQPRDEPRAALAALPDRPPRHPVPPLLGPRRQGSRHRAHPRVPVEPAAGQQLRRRPPRLAGPARAGAAAAALPALRRVRRARHCPTGSSTRRPRSWRTRSSGGASPRT